MAVVAVVASTGGFIFVFNGGGRQWLVVGVGLQRKWWVFRERERQRERKREYKKQYLNEMVKKNRIFDVL